MARQGRSAKTGKFVSVSYTKKHPGTTVIEKCKKTATKK